MEPALTTEDCFWEIGRERLIKDRKTADIREQIEALQGQLAEIEAPHNARIQELQDHIQGIVLQSQATAKSPYGSCSYVKGRKGSVKWADEALMGYAEAGHPEILQFRSEGEPGEATTRWILPKIEDLRKDLELEELRREKAAREAAAKEARAEATMRSLGRERDI